MTYPRGGYYDKEYMESSKALLHMEDVTDSTHALVYNERLGLRFSSNTKHTDMVKEYCYWLYCNTLYAFYIRKNRDYRVCTYHL